MNQASFPFDLSLVATTVKAGYLLGLSIYGVFGLVMIKQVRQMTMTVQGPLSGFLRLVSLGHFLLSLLILLVAIVVL